MKLGAAVRKRRKQLKKTLQEVALDIPGYDAGNLSRFERDEQDIDRDKLEPLAKSLEISISDLYKMTENHGSALFVSEDSHNYGVEFDNVEEAPVLKDGRYPLISWVQAGDFEEAYDNFEPGDAEEWMLAPPVNCSNKTYVLRVRGDSMTAPHGKSYPEGMLIYVDPDQKNPDSGMPVIAKVNGDNAVTFKQYINDGGNIYLKPLNPTHIPITNEFRILGTVVFAGFKP